MDVYCHPFTSGGQEIPIQEAKLAGLITLVTNYSCGEDLCVPEAESLPLEWSEYREHGTEFRKASTLPGSIAKQLHKVWKMPKDKREKLGLIARDWTIENFSIKNIGKKITDLIDASPKVNWNNIDIDLNNEKDPNCIIPNISDNKDWLTFMYHNILKMKNVDENDNGHKYWMHELNRGAKREDIENYFRKVAAQENANNKRIDFGSLLSPNPKRILIVIPESAGDVFMVSSLFESIKNIYPEYDLYVATKNQYFDILINNPYVHKVLPFAPEMDQLLLMEGAGAHPGFFDIAFMPHAGTQRFLNYLHNAKDKIEFDIK